MQDLRPATRRLDSTRKGRGASPRQRS
jgi:hypothetical protein